MKAWECTKNLMKSAGLGEESIPDSLLFLMTEYAEDYDIERRNGASIIHVFLRDVLGVKDITDENEIEKCEILSDLYDCRVCVNSIRQLYLRGIMEAAYQLPSGRKMFGGRDSFTEDELNNIIIKLNRYGQ